MILKKMFKFNFDVAIDDKESSRIFNNAEINLSGAKDERTTDCREAEENCLTEDILEPIDVYILNSISIPVGEIYIKYFSSSHILKDSKASKNGTEDIEKARQINSDLIPGTYEGGAKIWNCTLDVLNYLEKNYDSSTWKNKKVLDLGCGAGLLGIYAHIYGATVHFQDYNADVLKEITMPNLLLNTCKEDLCISEIKKRVRFYSGDWSKYDALTNPDERFDFILTSETIYNPTNYFKLLNVLHSKLKEDGVVLLAAKVYYFGVGGGIREFEKVIKDDKRFTSEIVYCVTNEGLGREILKLVLNRN